MGGPADGDEAEDSSHDEHNSGCDAHLALGRRILHTVGALPPGYREQDSHDTHDDGNDGEGPGGLEVRAEGQHGVVDLTLHLTCALHHAAHPDTLPGGLRGDDVAADESSDLPHGKGAHKDGTNPAQDAQRCAQHL